MNTTEVPNPVLAARVAARTRADRRLRRMTAGATIAAVAATGGFGLLAAVSYDGRTTATTVAVSTTTPTTSRSTSTSSTATTAPTVSVGQGPAHASTGGS